MGYRRRDGDVLGDFASGRCRRCFDKCEDALEFVEGVKDLLDEFFDDRDRRHCCCKPCCRRSDNYWGR